MDENDNAPVFQSGKHDCSLIPRLWEEPGNEANEHVFLQLIIIVNPQ